MFPLFSPSILGAHPYFWKHPFRGCFLRPVLMAEKKTFVFDMFHDSFRADSTPFFELINWRCFFLFFFFWRQSQPKKIVYLVILRWWPFWDVSENVTQNQRLLVTSNDRGSKCHGLNHLVGGGFKHVFMLMVTVGKWSNLRGIFSRLVETTEPICQPNRRYK